MMFLCIFLLVTPSTSASGPIVQAPSGTYHGTTLTAWNGQIYNGYLGIPYAKPPVGDLRFRPPVHSSHIDGLYDATSFKPYCVQLNIIANQFDLGQEDCLFLNVFTPRYSDRDNGKLKKVYVFFHGGGNTNGFPNYLYPGDLVTQHDVIVVTVAYRLGYLGLLSTMSPACEGNFHLKDQILSLVWVQENILDFGGDSKGVTVGGESAGSFDTSLITLAPESKNLFARAYSQSGTTGVKNSMLISSARPEAIKLSRKLGCVAHDQVDPQTERELEEMVNCLRQVPALKFSRNETTIDIPNLQPVLYGSLFPKSVEELFNDKKYLNSINFLDKEYLVGLDENEGEILNVLHELILSSLPVEIRNTLTPDVLFHQSITTFLAQVFGPVSEPVIAKVMEFYKSNIEFSPHSDFFADALFHFATLQYVTAAAAGRSYLDSKVYLFRFVHTPDYFIDPTKKLVHGFDLLYLFDLDIDAIVKIMPVKVDSSKWNEDDDKLRQTFMTMVADFINTGNPGKSLNTELATSWPGFDSQRQQYLEFGLRPQIKDHLLDERMRLWSEEIPQWIRENPLPQREEL